MRLSLLLARLWGIDVRIHLSFLLVVPMFAPMGLAGGILVLILFGSILIHEFGHCFAARSVGGEAHEIILWPLGGLAMINAPKGQPYQAIWVSLAGPLVHLPLAGLCAAVLAAQGHPPAWSDLNPLAEHWRQAHSFPELLAYLALKMQVMLFCFNVFTPAFPLDGGQALAALMSTSMPLRTAAFIMAGLNFGVMAIMVQQGSTFLAVLLGFYGFALLAPANDFHVLAPLYQRAAVAVAKPTTFVAEGLDLKPCLHCGQKLHPAAERCAYCDAKYPFETAEVQG